jgi:hypothetical protein
VEGLEAVSAAVFKKCKDGDNPLYSEKDGWRDWPKSANQDEVLEWLNKLIELFLTFAEEHGSAPKTRRKLIGYPVQPLQGSIANRKLDIGFVDNLTASESSQPYWLPILACARRVNE